MTHRLEEFTVVVATKPRYADSLKLEVHWHGEAHINGGCHWSLRTDIRAAESRSQGGTDVGAEVEPPC